MDFQAQLSQARIDDLTGRGLWLNRSFADALDEAAAAHPDALAIVGRSSMDGSETRMTYGELRRLSVRVAAGLAAHGVQRGDVVAVQLPNWWHFAVLYTACVRIGAVINPLMPVFRERELEYMLGFAEAKVWIVPREFRGFDYPAMAQGLRAALPALSHVFVVGGADPQSSFEQRLLAPAWEAETDTAALFSARRMSPNDVTEIMYTSGTTGTPKGVMHTANTLMCKILLATELFHFTRDDVIYMGSPLAHQTGFLYAVLFSIFHGTKCVLQDVWEPVEASRLIAEEGCTLTLGSTPFLSDLVRTEAARRYDTSSLRLFLCSGAPIPRVLVEDAQKTHPNMYVMSAWGMTEMGITTATYPGDPAEKVLDTDGRALPHQAVRVIDDEGRALPPGVEGRLQARCATTFVGYLKRPEAYGVDAEGWIETGDNARMDADGYIRITGRSKDIIIRGGENVPVVEVEELLYRHPAVEDAAVVAMPDPRLGERGCAFVSLKPGASLDFRGMVEYLVSCRMMKQYLPERLEIISAFPRTPSGKIQKFKLREQARTLTPMSLGD